RRSVRPRRAEACAPGGPSRTRRAAGPYAGRRAIRPARRNGLSRRSSPRDRTCRPRSGDTSESPVWACGEAVAPSGASPPSVAPSRLADLPQELAGGAQRGAHTRVSVRKECTVQCGRHRRMLQVRPLSEIAREPLEEMLADLVIAPVASDRGHAGRIVSPVIEPASRIEIDRSLEIEFREERLVLVHLQRTGEAFLEAA